MAAALVLHALAILLALVEWPDMGRAIEREIPVELVFERPDDRASRDLPPPDVRESGGDPSLAQGRPADAAQKPASPEALQLADVAPPLRKPAPPGSPAPAKQADAPPPPPKPMPETVPATQAPRLQPSLLALVGQGGGDAYLNQIHALIEKQRSYPDIGNPMRLSGVALYEIRITRDGQIVNVILLRSTGAGPLDLEGQKIVRRAGPFPPVPPDIPGPMVFLRLQLPIHP